jgi:hypothetical protein
MITPYNPETAARTLFDVACKAMLHVVLAILRSLLPLMKTNRTPSQGHQWGPAKPSGPERRLRAAKIGAQRMVESRDERTRDALMEKIVRSFAPEARPRSPTKGHR